MGKKMKKKANLMASVAADDDRPENCPYRDLVTLEFSGSPEIYEIHKNLLPPRIDTSFSYRVFRNSSQVLLRDIDKDIAYTFIHFLYTGRYQTLKPTNRFPEDDDILEYERALKAYVVSMNYSLEGLESLAAEKIEAISEKLPIKDVIKKLFGVLGQMKEENDWMASYLGRTLKKAVSMGALDRSSAVLNELDSALARTMLKWFVEMSETKGSEPENDEPKSEGEETMREKQEKSVEELTAVDGDETAISSQSKACQETPSTSADECAVKPYQTKFEKNCGWKAPTFEELFKDTAPTSAPAPNDSTAPEAHDFQDDYWASWSFSKKTNEKKETAEFAFPELAEEESLPVPISKNKGKKKCNVPEISGDLLPACLLKEEEKAKCDATELAEQDCLPMPIPKKKKKKPESGAPEIVEESPPLPITKKKKKKLKDGTSELAEKSLPLPVSTPSAKPSEPDVFDKITGIILKEAINEASILADGGMCPEVIFHMEQGSWEQCGRCSALVQFADKIAERRD